jgi:hypothetical protein
MIKKLTIREAYEVYTHLKQHLPETIDDDLLEFIGKIVSSIRESESYEDYSEVIELFTGSKFSTLAETYNPTEMLELFIMGLQDNQIIIVNKFFSEAGF